MAQLDAFLRPVHSVSEDASAADAARVLRDERIGAVLVVDAEGRGRGIVTDRDLALRIVGAQLDPRTTPVLACMSSPLVTLHPHDSPAEATRKMRERLVRRLPIVDSSGRLVGIVTADDLLRDLGLTIGLLASAPGQGFENETRGARIPDSAFGKE
jgi:CBS domain-containing protein